MTASFYASAKINLLKPTNLLFELLIPGRGAGLYELLANSTRMATTGSPPV